MRNSRAVVFGIVFPVVLLVHVQLDLLVGRQRDRRSSTTSRCSTRAIFTAGLAAYAIMLQSFSNLAITVTTQRESGQLKRLRGTPMRPWTFIAAHMLRAVMFAYRDGRRAAR